MISTNAKSKLDERVAKLYESKYAICYVTYESFEYENGGDDKLIIPAESYIVVEKQYYYNCYSNPVHRSRKCKTLKSARKAFEKYNADNGYKIA